MPIIYLAIAGEYEDSTIYFASFSKENVKKYIEEHPRWIEADEYSIAFDDWHEIKELELEIDLNKHGLAICG